MVNFLLLLTVLIASFSTSYGQAQEPGEKFQYKPPKYLYEERGNIIRDDIAAQIMEEKCLVCHEAGRILLERKSRKDWEKCVADMRIQVRKDFKKDWFTKDEFNLIVDLLAKTQGIKGLAE